MSRPAVTLIIFLAYYVNRLTNSSSTSDCMAVKVYVRTPRQAINREKVAEAHLAELQTANPGCFFIRQVLDSFELLRSNGDSHLCFVHEPLQISLYSFQRPGRKAVPFSVDLVKPVIIYILKALDFLHTDAGITHCGKHRQHAQSLGTA